jgi:hypothetical protein
MDVLSSCFGLCLLFAGWIVVGVVNVVVLQNHADNPLLSLLGLVTWLFSGPVWAFLFFRWRGRKFSAAYDRIRSRLLGKTRERLQKHSIRE